MTYNNYENLGGESGVYTAGLGMSRYLGFSHALANQSG